MANQNNSSLETRITGSFSTQFWLELFGNSAHFPIVNILLELLIEDLPDYLFAPDLYTLIAASLVQAYWLTRWRNSQRPRRFWGNLIGPALYTLVEGLLEGPVFFAAPHHLTYWGIALALGVLQALRPRLPAVFTNPLLLVENLTRTSILFIMYAIFEKYTTPLQTSSLRIFFSDASHQFIGLTVLFLGLSIGLANLTADHYLGLLQNTSARLKTYSEWLLGRELLEQTFINPSTLTLTRRERTILFMDIRGFTHWSKAQPPEVVVSLLDSYYQTAESVLSRHHTIKFKFSADEVMAVFATADDALQATLELRSQIHQLLSDYDLGAGSGLHTGALVEGLLGSAGVKFYDVIGDTVNIAKRIESAAGASEILISAALHALLDQTYRTGDSRQIMVKGKEHPLTVYPLEK